MAVACERIEMGKKPIPPEPEPVEDRVTLANLKGSRAEKAFLNAFSRKTGMPISEIIRRGVARIAADRGIEPPEDWVGE